MNSLTSFLESDFNTQQDQWEKSLLSELKISEIGNKATRKLLSGLTWPTLSLKAMSESQLTSSEWKKASNTYVSVNEAELIEDLKAGVRNFFFLKMDESGWSTVERTFKSFEDKQEIEVFLLNGERFSSESFKVVSQLLSGREFHDQGGHTIQELGLLTKDLIENLHVSQDIYLGVYVDSYFFQNIAKLRAARLLATKVLEEEKLSKKIHIVALTSYQGWTLFERYSNMLRNETAVAAAYVGGADFIQSSGYNVLFELETDDKKDEHRERSSRMARNTAHILGLESMLGVVQDASFGSYHLENLTHAFCEEAWKLMQRLLRKEDISPEIEEVRKKRLEMIKTRKTILSGINDYPDVAEQLEVNLKAPSFFRTARIFEELRLRMQKLKKPEVYVALFGDYGALNARLNFVKNYFELLGLKVIEPGHSVLDINEFKENLLARKEEIIVLCSSDELYPEMKEASALVQASHRFIAGKYQLDQFRNLFAGQNIYEVLETLVNDFERRKA